MNQDICDQCGAVKQVYLEQMHEECWHGHRDRNPLPLTSEVIDCAGKQQFGSNK